MKKTILMLSAVLSASLVGVSSAHAPEQRIAYYNPPGRVGTCAVGLARIAHGNWGKGFTRANSYSVGLDPVFGSECAVPDHKPAGYVRSHFTYQVHRPGGWAYCDNSNWHWNTSRGWQVEVYRNYGHRPCGRAFYRTVGAHAVWIKSAWRNAFTVTREHWFG